MPGTTLIISSKNYSSWSLRGWLITRLSGLPFTETVLTADDRSAREELLLRSSSTLVPRLEHDGLSIWDTMAIAEYLNEIRPDAGLLPKDRSDRARCRSICGEMHSGFGALRSALPMNLRVERKGFRVWSGAQADIDRITTIWRDCLTEGPYLFGAKPTVADAMYAPVVTRFLTYDVSLDSVSARYCQLIMSLPDMQEWVAAARTETEEVEELEVEF